MKKQIFLTLSFFLITVSLFGQYNSVLSSGKWFKISTHKAGIYKLDYSSILSLGVVVNDLQISSIKLYGNGGGMLSKLNSDFRHNDLVENAITIYDSNIMMYLKTEITFCFMAKLHIVGNMMLNQVYLNMKHIYFLMK